MRKKGFTLIELLAVIIILSIILSITVPRILDLVNDRKYDIYSYNEQKIIKAADDYLNIYLDKIPEGLGDTTEITLQELVDEKVLSEIKDPKDSSKMASGYVLVTNIGNNKNDFEVHINYDEIYQDNSTDKLVAHYKFKDNTIDYSLNTNHPVTDTVTYQNDRFENKRSAIETGTNKYLGLGNVNFDYQDFTIEVWVKGLTNEKTDPKYPKHITNIIGKGDWNTTNNWFIGFKSSGSNPALDLTFVYGKTWGSGASYSLDNIDLSKWNHFVGVATSTNQYLYVNGELVNSISSTHVSVTNALELQIGKTSYTNMFYSGIIDDIKIYNRAKNSDEIKKTYETGLYY